MTRFFFAAMLAVLLTACSDNGLHGLTGTYGYDEAGHAVPLLKVELDSGKYSVSRYDATNHSWIVDGDAYPLTEVQLQRLVGVTPDAGMAGLQSASTVFVHVPKGWSQGRFTAKTGYILRFAHGAQELERIS